jgi:hypothetical protein
MGKLLALVLPAQLVGVQVQVQMLVQVFGSVLELQEN